MTDNARLNERFELERGSNMKLLARVDYDALASKYRVNVGEFTVMMTPFGVEARGIMNAINSNFSSRVGTLVKALERLVYECGSYGPKNRREYLQMGPILEPSEQAVLEGRKALEAFNGE